MAGRSSPGVQRRMVTSFMGGRVRYRFAAEVVLPVGILE